MEGACLECGMGEGDAIGVVGGVVSGVINGVINGVMNGVVNGVVDGDSVTCACAPRRRNNNTGASATAADTNLIEQSEAHALMQTASRCFPLLPLITTPDNSQLAIQKNTHYHYIK